jgi:hypothetical protein
MNREQRQAALAAMAQHFVGVHEEGGNNRGPMVEKFQRAVDGAAQREPWCMAFVQYCLRAVDELAEMLGDKAKHVLPPSELTTFVYGHAPVWARIDAPELGAVVVWAKLGTGGELTTRGHCGIVAATVQAPAGMNLITIEGNTAPGDAGEQREGDGVYVRGRALGELPGFRRMGYLRPWL